jgi:hypothetical protein
MLAYMLSQFLWLTWITLDSFLLYSIFPDMKLMNVFQRLQKAWLGIATLMSVFITANILLIFMKRYSLRNQLLFMCALVVLHFAVSGALYIPETIPTAWSKMTALWIIFMYFFDITPPLFVFSSLLKSMPKPRSAKNLHNYDRFVGILLMLQVVNACWFGSMVYVTQYTGVLMNDRNYLSMGGPFSFSFVFHSIVSCVLNHHIRYMLSLGARLEMVHDNSTTLKSSRTQILPLIKTDFNDHSRGPSSGNVLLPNSAYSPNSSTPRSFSDWENVSITSESVHRSGGNGLIFASVNEPFKYEKSIRTNDTTVNSIDGASTPTSTRKEHNDPYQAFRADPDEARRAKSNANGRLRVDTSFSTLTPPCGRSSPSISPLQGYKTLERPHSTYSALFEAHKERHSSNIQL